MFAALFARALEIARQKIAPKEYESNREEPRKRDKSKRPCNLNYQKNAGEY